MLRLVRVGNSTGLIIPKAALRNMNVREGDYVFLSDTRDGYRITPYDPVLEAQFGVADFAARRHRNVLRALED